MSRPPFPPFDDATARQKVRMAENAWNNRDPDMFTLAYTEDSIWRNRAEFLSGHREIHAFQASVSETGWPYVQFRGGAPGFIRMLNDKTIAYADLRGNRQYISAGNLTHSPRLSIIVMDYPNQRRLKLRGEAEVIDAEPKPDILSALLEGAEKVERIIFVRMFAFDWNCPRHIPRRFTLD